MKFVIIGLCLCLCMCTKLANNPLSISADDNFPLKIAVNYIGDDKCREQHATDLDIANGVIVDNEEKSDNLQTHLLSGRNGELISDEFKTMLKNQGNKSWQTLMFSGDRLFQWDDKPLTMDTIEQSCRRLVLIIDSDTKPTVDFTAGFALSIKQQQARFEKIALPEFGALSCLTDKPFCTFANINKGKRYFSLIWPDQATQRVSVKVSWTTGTAKEKDTITVSNLTYQDNNTPQAWE